MTANCVRMFVASLCALPALSLAVLSAHVVKGLASPDAAAAFVSSPTASADPLIPVTWGAVDTHLRVACFYVANTSQARPDSPSWPRVTGVGIELPDTPRGFSLLEPLDGDWDLVEGIEAALPNNGVVTLDFAVVARVNPMGRSIERPDQIPPEPRGIPPGQTGVRGNGTRFCVSGPFPDTLPNLGATTIEKVLNGVVVAFHGVADDYRGFDAGVWFPTPLDPSAPPRQIPLYP